MTKMIVVFGYGTVGRLIVEMLTARGEHVRIATRNRPDDLPAGAEHVRCDVLQSGDVALALDGA